MNAQGFEVVRGLLPNARALAERVEAVIDTLPASIGATREEYLSSVSVWRKRSLVVAAIREEVEAAVRPLVAPGDRIAKMSVIRKSALASLATPTHQDATYPNAEPYVLSVWVALDDVGPDQAPLEVLPGSHLRPPEPWVDFWAPGFTDRDRTWWKRLEVEAGDAVIFDPFLWHGSGPLRGGVRRAVTMRWTRDGARWRWPIPEGDRTGFGMMTCRGMLETALRERGGTGTYEEMLAKEPAMRPVAVMHAADREHDAGDQVGTVYRGAWGRLVRLACHDDDDVNRSKKKPNPTLSGPEE
jgi:hypothetical protein